jgi:hypothetical protein
MPFVWEEITILICIIFYIHPKGDNLKKNIRLKHVCKQEFSTLTYSYEKVWCCISSCFHKPTPPSLLRNIISCNHHSPQVLASHLTIICLKIKRLLHCHQPSASHQTPEWKFHAHVYYWIYAKIQIYSYILFWMTSCSMMMHLITRKFAIYFYQCSTWLHIAFDIPPIPL